MPLRRVPQVVLREGGIVLRIEVTVATVTTLCFLMLIADELFVGNNNLFVKQAVGFAPGQGYSFARKRPLTLGRVGKPSCA